ncbi:MAG: hypothetical protein GXO47_06100 [Chlorobi bacterium]|nr:hypothetical protein [Chlorobiota bacterium]
MISRTLSIILKIFFIVVFSLNAQLLHSQARDTIGVQKYIDNFNKKTINNKEEKIFIFTDRPAYYSGDTLWFRAHVLFALTLGKQPIEKIMYLELAGKDGFRMRRTYRVVAGAINGVFYIPKNIPTGKYKLIARTNWMLNKNGGKYFEKDIYIYNHHHEGSRNDVNEQLLSSSEQSDTNKYKDKKPDKGKNQTLPVSINFYPEGGYFIEGIATRMAIEVRDHNGKPLDVDGYVKDNNGNFETFFKTLKGKGSFMIFPDKDKKYFAYIKGKYENQPVSLPDAEKYGYVLNVTNSFEKDTLFFRIVAKTPDAVPQHFYLLGIQNGIVKMAQEGNVSNKNLFFIGSKKKFSTGIVRFVLLDENFIPRCERLSFINRYPDLEISIDVKDSVFTKKSKISFDIYAKDNKGAPVSGDIALSVTDAGIISDSLYDGTNIVNYLYFLSDLPGIKARDVTFAMQKNEASHMFMDLLMLTNGWSKYKWRKITSLTDTIPEHYIEEECFLEGIVKRRLSGKPAPKIRLSAYMKGEYNDFYTTKADNKGWFRFNLMDFSDTVDVIIQSLNRLNAKGNYIFELKSNLPFINTEKNDTLIRIADEGPLAEYHFDSTKTGIILPNINTIKHQRMNYDSEMAMVGDTSAILLGEVNIEATKKKTPKGLINELYGSPDYVVSGAQIEKIDTENGWLSNIFEIISYALPDVSITVDHNKINDLRVQEDGLMPGQNDSISELDTETSRRLDLETNSTLHFDTYRLPPKLMHITVKNAGSPYYYIFIDGKYIASTNDFGDLDIMRFPYTIFDLMNFNPHSVKSVEIIMNVKEDPKDISDDDFFDFARELGRPAIISIYTYDNQGLESTFGEKFRGIKELQMLGFVREKEFYSPSYADTTEISKTIDQRVTLFWEPQINLDSTGHASLSFYNSDIAKSLRFELSGMSSERIPLSKMIVKNSYSDENIAQEESKQIAQFDFDGSSITKNSWEEYIKRYGKSDIFTGIIVGSNGNPVPLADIFVKKSEIQTSANISGIFMLKRKDIKQNDSIFISAPGKGYLAESIEKITSGNGVVRLKRENIIQTSFTPKELIPLVLQKAKKDNPNNRSFEAVYRETIIQDGFVYAVSDMKVILEQYGYGRTELPHISQLIDGRRFRTPDFHQAVIFKPVEPVSEDIVQLRDFVLDGLSIMKSPYKKSMKFDVAGKMRYRDRTVYKLVFTQKENTIYSLYDGFMLVDTADYGIVYVYQTPSAAGASYRSASSYLKNDDRFENIMLISDNQIFTYKKVNGKYVSKLQYTCVQLDLNGTPVAYIREMHGYGKVNEKGRLYKKINPLKNSFSRSLMIKEVMYNPSLWRNPTYLPPDINMLNQSGYLHAVSFYKRQAKRK